MNVEFMNRFLVIFAVFIYTFRRARTTKTNRRNIQDAGTILLASAALLLFVMPALISAGAAPINANLSWNPGQIQIGQTTTATFGVAADSHCPAGATFSG